MCVHFCEIFKWELILYMMCTGKCFQVNRTRYVKWKSWSNWRLQADKRMPNNTVQVFQTQHFIENLVLFWRSYVFIHIYIYIYGIEKQGSHSFSCFSKMYRATGAVCVSIWRIEFRKQSFELLIRPHPCFRVFWNSLLKIEHLLII